MISNNHIPILVINKTCVFSNSVYLRTDPEVAYKRIVQRGRFEETAIKMDYLQSIHNLHEDWVFIIHITYTTLLKMFKHNLQSFKISTNLSII